MLSLKGWISTALYGGVRAGSLTSACVFKLEGRESVWRVGTRADDTERVSVKKSVKNWKSLLTCSFTLTWVLNFLVLVVVSKQVVYIEFYSLIITKNTVKYKKHVYIKFNNLRFDYAC